MSDDFLWRCYILHGCRAEKHKEKNELAFFFQEIQLR